MDAILQIWAYFQDELSGKASGGVDGPGRESADISTGGSPLPELVPRHLAER
jgi:hypothetical protein